LVGSIKYANKTHKKICYNVTTVWRTAHNTTIGEHIMAGKKKQPAKPKKRIDWTLYVERDGVGRPSKYCPEIVDAAAAYLEQFEEETDEVPSVVGLALHLEISSETLYNWSKDTNKPEFFGIVQRVLDLQHNILLKNGLNGQYNASIAKLMLTKHGYSDKQEVDQNVKGEMSHQVNYGDAVADALKSKYKK